MKVIAAIQARMASTRLPGKVMKEILGRPVIWHIFSRLKQAKLVNQIIIATSNNPDDKVIAGFAKANAIDCYTGSENDIVDRLYQPMKQFKADAIVRITADCPLADPGIVDKVTGLFLDAKGGYDYVSNINPPTFPDGLDTEIFSFTALERVWHETKTPFEREWIAANFFEHPEKFRLGNVTNDSDLSHMRWTVDYQDDFDFVMEIYKRLYRPDKTFLMEDVLDLLKKYPELSKINQSHARNEGYTEALKNQTRL